MSRRKLLNIISLVGVVFFAAWLLTTSGCVKLIKENKSLTKKESDRQTKLFSKHFEFSGHVLSKDGKPISAAKIEVGGRTTESNKDGFFRLIVTQQQSTKAKRFVLNIRKHKYGLLSKVYNRSHKNGRYTLTPATIKYIDPKEDSEIIDRRIVSGVGPICYGTYSSRVDWNEFPLLRKPRFVTPDGQISTNVPTEVYQALKFIENAKDCNPGIRVRIRANSLVDDTGNPPPDKVEVSVSTIDIYDPDSMPGNYMVVEGGQEKFMIPFGAGIVDVKAGEKKFNLKKGMEAEIQIPIHPLLLKTLEKPASSIPLLVYDEKQGVWKNAGTAKLHKDGSSYVGKISHFSAYNMDFVKDNPTCVKIDSNAIDNDYNLEASVVVNGVVKVDTKRVENTTVKIHAIFNLPSYSTVTLRAFRLDTPFNPLITTTSVSTGPPATPGDSPYDACGPAVILTYQSSPPTGPILWLANSPSSTGDFTLEWDYQWNIPSSQDYFRLYEKTSTTDYNLIVSNISSSERSYPLSKAPGTYWYQLIPYSGATSSALTPSNEVMVYVPSAGSEIITSYASADNLLIHALPPEVTTPPPQDTVIQYSELAIGCNYAYGAITMRLCYASALKFDIQAAIAGRTITQARLELGVKGWPQDLNSTYVVGAFQNDWDPASITMNNAPNILDDSLIYFYPPTSAQSTISIDVTGIVQSWANGDYMNYGIAITDAEWLDYWTFNIGRETWFWSMDNYVNTLHRPKLIIELQ